MRLDETSLLLLAALRRRPTDAPPPTLTELAEEIYVAPSTVAKARDRLAALGLLDFEEGKQRTMHLTPAGLAYPL